MGEYPWAAAETKGMLEFIRQLQQWIERLEDLNSTRLNMFNAEYNRRKSVEQENKRLRDALERSDIEAARRIAVIGGVLSQIPDPIDKPQWEVPDWHRAVLAARSRLLSVKEIES